MANRRMFSNRIANSARFLQMPAEAQVLYFHMILRADDDGIVESYPLMKLLGVASDNFKILQAKGFIEQLNEDQVVVITDWTEHNVIRADRKVDSIYLPLLLNRNPDAKILQAKPRSDVKDNSKRLGGQSTDGISYVMLGKDKLGKDIILKDNTQKRDNPIKGDKLVNKVIEEFEEALGFKPTDRKPRYQAYNLVRRLQAIIKDNGKEANEEVSLKAINSYFKWLKKQDWFGMVQTLDTCRRKTDIFVHDYNLK